MKVRDLLGVLSGMDLDDEIFIREDDHTYSRAITVSERAYLETSGTWVFDTYLRELTTELRRMGYGTEDAAPEGALPCVVISS